MKFIQSDIAELFIADDLIADRLGNNLGLEDPYISRIMDIVFFAISKRRVVFSNTLINPSFFFSNYGPWE